jgi:hypothetical protein
MCNAYYILVRKPEERRSLREVLDIDGRVILEWI